MRREALVALAILLGVVAARPTANPHWIFRVMILNASGDVTTGTYSFKTLQECEQRRAERYQESLLSSKGNVVIGNCKPPGNSAAGSRD